MKNKWTKKSSKTKVKECAEKDTRIGALKYFQSFFPALEHIQYMEKRKGNRRGTEYSTEGSSVCSQSIVFQPVISTITLSPFHLFFSFFFFHGKTLSGSRRGDTDPPVWERIVCYAIFISVFPFAEIMLRTYWRAIP